MSEYKKEDTIALAVLGGIILITLVLYSGIGIDLPIFTPPPPDGPLPTAAYETRVKLVEPPWTLQPRIDSVTTVMIGVPYAVESEEETKPTRHIYWLPWEGKLRLVVQYPYGQVVVFEKPVKIEWWSDQTISFRWETKQPGTHVIRAELYNKEGMLVEAKTDEVVR